MAKNWEYAQMSQRAAAAGGPEAWLDAIKEAAYEKGVSDTKSKLVVPVGLVCVLIGWCGTYMYQKIRKRISDKKEEKLLIEQEAIDAENIVKKELVEAAEKINGDNTENDLEE